MHAWLSPAMDTAAWHAGNWDVWALLTLALLARVSKAYVLHAQLKRRCGCSTICTSSLSPMLRERWCVHRWAQGRRQWTGPMRLKPSRPSHLFGALACEL